MKSKKRKVSMCINGCTHNQRTKDGMVESAICCIASHASSANDRPTLGFFFTFFNFGADAAPPLPPSSSSPPPTTFRLAIVGLDLEDGPGPEDEEENERPFFSLASWFFASPGLEPFASPNAVTADGSGSGERPFALNTRKRINC